MVRLLTSGLLVEQKDDRFMGAVQRVVGKGFEERFRIKNRFQTGFRWPWYSELLLVFVRFDEASRDLFAGNVPTGTALVSTS
jgi:hypothetical protein